MVDDAAPLAEVVGARDVTGDGVVVGPVEERSVSR